MVQSHAESSFETIVAYLKSSKNISKDDQELMEKTKQFVKERHGDHEGLLCVICCLELESLIKVLPEYVPEPNLTGNTMCSDVMEHITTWDLSILLTGIVLGRWADFDLDDYFNDDAMFADRIMGQMEQDIETKERFRYPKLYRVGSAKSLAVAVVIDDRYWTDEWPANRPSKLWR